VRSLQFLFFPIAWPIARLLDFLLHDHEENAHERYSRAELRAVLALHAPRDDTTAASREEISKSSSQEHRPPRAKRRTSLVAELLSKDHIGATTSVASSVSPDMPGACLSGRGTEFSDPWVVPETCLAAGKPTIDSMEFALLLAAMTMRETPLHLCGAMTPLESSQIVSAISSVSSVCEGIMHREITSEWLVVVHQAGLHQEGQTGGELQKLRRNHVLGVLPLASLLLAHQHAEEDEVGNYFKDVFRIPVWLQSKESTLAGYRELVRARGSGGPPGRGQMPLGLVIGSEMGDQGEGEACSSVSEIVLGTITLEDLAVAMACGESAIRTPPCARGPPCARPALPAWGALASAAEPSSLALAVGQPLPCSSQGTPRSMMPSNIRTPRSGGQSHRMVLPLQAVVAQHLQLRSASWSRSQGTSSSNLSSARSQIRAGSHSWPDGYAPIRTTEDLGT